MGVTTNKVGDSPMAAELLLQIPSHEMVASCIGDGAYVHETSHRRGAFSINPLRKGAWLRKGLAFPHRREGVKACKRLGEKVMTRTF